MPATAWRPARQEGPAAILWTKRGSQKPCRSLPRVLPHTRDRFASASGTLLSVESFRRPARKTSQTIATGIDSSQPRVIAGRATNEQVRDAPYFFALRALCSTEPFVRSNRCRLLVKGRARDIRITRQRSTQSRPKRTSSPLRSPREKTGATVLDRSEVSSACPRKPPDLDR